MKSKLEKIAGKGWALCMDAIKAEQAVEEAKRKEQEALAVIVESFAEHKVGDIVHGKRSMSGTPNMMMIDKRTASVQYVRGVEKDILCIFITYWGREMKKGGQVGSIESYATQGIEWRAANIVLLCSKA